MALDWTNQNSDAAPVLPSQVNRLVRSMGEQVKILRGQVLTVGVNRIPHGLDPREPLSVVVQVTGSWDAVYAVSFDTKHVTCTSTYGSVADIWVAF